MPTPAATTSATPTNDIATPDGLARIERVGADEGSDDRGEHGRGGDQQRGIAGGDRLQSDRPEDLVDTEPEAAQEDDPPRVPAAASGSRPRTSAG